MIDYLGYRLRLFDNELNLSNCSLLSIITPLLIIALTISVIILIIHYTKFKLYSNIINQIPGPASRNLFIGNLDLFYVSAKTKHWFQSSYNTLIGLTKVYQNEGIFRLWIGPINPVVVLLNPDYVEVVFNYEVKDTLLSNSVNITKAYEYKFLRPWLGYGLLTSYGEKWKTHRKLLTPAFHFKILENFLPTITKQMNIMLELIDKQMIENNGIIEDVRQLITNCTLDSICETAMGVTVNAQLNPNSDYVEAIRRTFAVSIIRFIKPWLWTDFTFYLSSLGKLLQKRLKILHSFTDSVIRERKQEILENVKDINNNNVLNSEAIDEAMNTIGMKRRLVFLDILINYHLKNPQKMNELDVRSEVDTFMFGGHDTTASALMFALLLIGNDSDVQAKIHEELDEIFSDDMTRNITVDDLRKMKYLEQCVKECLRLYPPIQIIGRQTINGFTLNHKYEIPSGSTCYVPLLCVHRDPNHFPNPEDFNPERFSTEECAGRHPYAFIPFSAGPRNCIGQKFAILEEKALLATIFRKYKIQSLVNRNDIKVDISIVLKPSTKLRMKFELR